MSGPKIPTFESLIAGAAAEGQKLSKGALKAIDHTVHIVTQPPHANTTDHKAEAQQCKTKWNGPQCGA